MKINNLIFSFVLLLISGSVFSQNNCNDSIIIPYEEIKIMCTQTRGGNYVIKNNTEYQELLYERSQHPYCDDYELPYIDFDKYTLISHHSGTGGCKVPDYIYEIKKYGNTYSVNIKITVYGICRRANYIHIWSLIPKIELNSEVEFNIKKEHIALKEFKRN